MERITPSGSPDLNRPRGKNEKVEKKKKTSFFFLETLEKVDAGAGGTLQGDMAFDEDIPLEDMLDEIHSCGDKLKEAPSLSLVMEYKQAVRNFMHYVIRESLKTETKEGARFNPLRKQKRFTIVRVVNDKLERLAAGILQSQKPQLDLLKSIDEINGLLVDLMG
ncbi:MAG: DUF327 family protein [Spirochaetales bacterium]|nr:DUF327 family protein [Spirochaetales bacterium]